MLEFTKSNKHKKNNPDKNGKYSKARDFALSKLNFIIGIIHRLNYFDIFLVFVIAIVLGFLIHNRIQRKPEWINVRVSIENADWWYGGSPPEYWYGSDLKEGKYANDSFGNSSAEITKIENFDNSGPYRTIYLNLKLRVDYDKKRKQYLFEYKPLVVGSSISLNFDNQRIQGLVVGINNQEIDYQYKVIKVRRQSYSGISTSNMKPITPEFASKIKVGDKYLDNNNDLVTEIMEIKNNPSSYYSFSDIRGSTVLTYDPRYRDLDLTLKIKTHNEMGLYFSINKAPIKIGSKLWIHFPEYSLEDYEVVEIVK